MRGSVHSSERRLPAAGGWVASALLGCRTFQLQTGKKGKRKRKIEEKESESKPSEGAVHPPAAAALGRLLRLAVVLEPGQPRRRCVRQQRDRHQRGDKEVWLLLRARSRRQRRGPPGRLGRRGPGAVRGGVPVVWLRPYSGAALLWACTRPPSSCRQRWRCSRSRLQHASRHLRAAHRW